MNILDDLFGWAKDAVVDSSDAGQKGHGLFTSDLIGSIIQGGVGLAGIYMSQKQQRKQLEQLNAQANDEYALAQQKLKQEEEIAMAGIEAQKQATLMNAYRNYLDSIAGARSDTRQGYRDLADSMATPLNYRSAVLK